MLYRFFCTFTEKISTMEVKIASDWKALLAEEFSKPYFEELTRFVKEEYATRRIYPRGSNIFRAFDKCPLD